MMTQTQAVSAIKALGMTCRVFNGEYRVSFHPACLAEALNLDWPSAVIMSEGLAYYTDCRLDAVLTATAMKQRGY